MQAIHDLLMSMTALLFAISGMVVLLDLWHELEYRRSVARGISAEAPSSRRWKVSLALALVAWLPLIAALCMALFTSGRVGVRLGKGPTAQVRVVARTDHRVRNSAAKAVVHQDPRRHG